MRCWDYLEDFAERNGFTVFSMWDAFCPHCRQLAVAVLSAHGDTGFLGKGKDVIPETPIREAQELFPCHGPKKGYER